MFKKYYFLLVYKNKVIEIDRYNNTYFVCDRFKWFIEYYKPYKNNYIMLNKIETYER